MEFNVVLVLSFQPFKGLLSVYFYQLGSNQKILEEFRVIIFFSTPAHPFELLPIFLSLIYLKLKYITQSSINIFITKLILKITENKYLQTLIFLTRK